jgi:hypothetical protein
VQLPHFYTDAHFMVHLCSSHYFPEQVTFSFFHLLQFSNPLSLLTFSNLFCSHHFLTSPFSYSTHILWTSQLTPLHLQTPLHSLRQLCFPLIPFFSSNGWSLEKWWIQICVRKGKEFFHISASANIRETSNSTRSCRQNKKKGRKKHCPDFQGQLSTQSSADRGGTRMWA